MAVLPSGCQAGGRAIGSPQLLPGQYEQSTRINRPSNLRSDRRKADHNVRLGEEEEMRAICVTAYGGPEVLQLQEVPTPEPGPGQVRIKTAATTVNFADIQGRRAQYHGGRLPP